MKISAFCLTTNNIKKEFPFIESIKSWLNIADELIVIDGGSTDGTIEAIKAIGDDRIRIISDESTKWEKDWYYSRLGKNFNRGLKECTGDLAFKFDCDFILHESSYNLPDKNFKKDCKHILDRQKLVAAFTRKNFVLIDRWFPKSLRTLGINLFELKKRGMKIRYGIDLKKSGWSFEPIIPQKEENGIWFGHLLRSKENSVKIHCNIFNYDRIFNTAEVVKKIRLNYMLASIRQYSLKYKYINQPVSTYTEKQLLENPEIVWGVYKKMVVGNYSKPQTPLTIEQHPKIIQDKVRNLKPEQMGYNSWGWLEEAGYGINKATYY